MEPGFVQWLVSQTGIAGLAGFALYMLDRTNKQAQLLSEQYAASNREDKLLLLKVLDQHASIQATMVAKIDSLLGLAVKREEWINNEQHRSQKSNA